MMKTGEQLKHEGQAKMLAHVGAGWFDYVLVRFMDFCTEKFIGGARDVTFDEFRASGMAPEPPHPNAWGVLPKKACRAGLICPTDRTAKALRPKAHARRVRVWDICPEAL